jgi:hypothetical protein
MTDQEQKKSSYQKMPAVLKRGKTTAANNDSNLRSTDQSSKRRYKATDPPMVYMMDYNSKQSVNTPAALWAQMLFLQLISTLLPVSARSIPTLPPTHVYTKREFFSKPPPS